MEKQETLGKQIEYDLKRYANINISAKRARRITEIFLSTVGIWLRAEQPEATKAIDTIDTTNQVLDNFEYK